MDNRQYVYLTEVECEEKLVKALKEKPALIHSGRVEKFNVSQNIIPPRKLMQFALGSVVVLVFDTDKEETEILRKNIALLKSLSFKVEVLTVVQVLNFEDEIERSTDVLHAQDFTRSISVNDFKRAVNRMKEKEFRSALKRHKLNLEKLWSVKPPKGFSFIKQDAEKIKSVEGVNRDGSH